MTIEERNAVHTNYERVSQLLDRFERETYQARTIEELEQAVERHGKALFFQKELSLKLQES